MRHAPKKRKKILRNNGGRLVGYISKPHRIAWSVSPHRADQRTGAERIGTFGSYAQQMLKEMTFK